MKTSGNLHICFESSLVNNLNVMRSTVDILNIDNKKLKFRA